MIRKSGGISREKGGDWEEYWCPAPTDCTEADSGRGMLASEASERIPRVYYPTLLQLIHWENIDAIREALGA